jgi:hypothetical protein
MNHKDVGQRCWMNHKDVGSIQEYERLQTKGIQIAIRKSDHPEIDTLVEIDEEGMLKKGCPFKKNIKIP